MPKHLFGPSDRVIVAGASGLIGRALVASLREQGVTVQRLVRRDAHSSDEISWDPAAPLDPAVLAGARAVVGLNGASIGRLPWTPRYKSELLWSRLTPIRTLASAVTALGTEAPQLVGASAVGYYGSVPGRRVTESSAGGTGFLADICRDIESAARRASPPAVVTNLRIAPVIHREGVLKPLLTLTALGISGPLGSGTQQWPWISLDDAIAAIIHTITHRIDGPVNITGPTPACANDIGFALAREMNRPFLIPAPAFALRAALGDAAEGLLLSDTDVVPEVLETTGFTWTHRTAEDAVRAALRDG